MLHGDSRRKVLRLPNGVVSRRIGIPDFADGLPLAVFEVVQVGAAMLPRSDYWRFGVNLFVDGPITRRLALNIMYTQDWEWHTEAGDDLSVLLLSAGLRYRI